jgi:peroxiredoxin
MLPIPTEKEFIFKHPNSYLSADLLVYISEKEMIPLDSIKSLYNRMDKKIQNSIKGQEIRNEITRIELAKTNCRTGDIAPDFKVKDLHQQAITLSQFRDRNIVLLDFWTSWCSPCKEGLPYVTKLYEKYHSKGLEIIAISSDEDKKKWITAVKENGTDMWHHVHTKDNYDNKSDQKKQNGINDRYSVRGVPSYILVDKNGKIVERWTGFSKENLINLEQKIAELLKEK